LPAKRYISQYRFRLTHRLRWQASAYRGCTLLSEPCPRKIVIYSELARHYLKRHGESHYEH